METVALVTSPVAASPVAGAARRQQGPLSASVAIKRTDFVAARDVIDWDHQPGQETHQAKEQPRSTGEAATAHQTGQSSDEDGHLGKAAADVASAGRAAGIDVPVESDGDTESLSNHGDVNLDPDMAGWDVAADHEQEQPARPPAAAVDYTVSASPDASVAATNQISPSVSATEASPDAPSSSLWSPRQGGAAASCRGTSVLLDDVAKRSQLEKPPSVTREHVFVRVVPESPLLSWNPDDASEAFGSVAPPTKRHTAVTRDPVGQILVPETQISISQEEIAQPRRRRESIFVPETQMPPPAASPRVKQPAGPLGKQVKEAARRLTDGNEVLVLETQREQDNALARKFPGWLSQSVDAAEAADGPGPSPVSSGGSVAEPTLYTASMAAPPVNAGDGGAAYSSDEEEPLPQQDQHASPFRAFSDDELPPSPLLASSEAVRSPLLQQRPARQRATRGFESSSEDDDAARDSNDEALSPPRWVKQRQRAVQSQMRTTSNPFAASAIALSQRSAGCTDRRMRGPPSSASQQPRISMNPGQPDLASMLRQNAAPLPHRRRRVGSPASRRPRAVSGKRPRPTFSWTDKPQVGLADTFLQRSEAVRAVQKKKKTKGVSAKQQRLSSWAEKVG